MFNKIVPIGKSGYAFAYENYHMRKMTNEERYEGYMRSDFSTHKVADFDNVEIIKVPSYNGSTSP